MSSRKGNMMRVSCTASAAFSAGKSPAMRATICGAKKTPARTTPPSTTSSAFKTMLARRHACASPRRTE
jgi:hypothetical protein